MPKVSSDLLSLKDALDYYENGKHRRYALLFSLNGGAFLIFSGFCGFARMLVGGSVYVPSQKALSL